MIIQVWVARNKPAASPYIRIYRALCIQGPELELETGRHITLHPSELNRNKPNSHWDMLNCHVPMGRQWDNAGDQGEVAWWWAGCQRPQRSLAGMHLGAWCPWRAGTKSQRKEEETSGRECSIHNGSKVNTYTENPARLLVARCIKKPWIVVAQVWPQENYGAGAWNFQSHPSSREDWKLESIEEHIFKVNPLCKIKILCVCVCVQDLKCLWLGECLHLCTRTRCACSHGNRNSYVGSRALDLTSSVGYVNPLS